jgi:hypothetical protein
MSPVRARAHAGGREIGLKKVRGKECGGGTNLNDMAGMHGRRDSEITSSPAQALKRSTYAQPWGGAIGRIKMPWVVIFKAISLPPSLNIRPNSHRRLVNELTVVCQGEFTSRITEAANNVSNSFDQVSHAYPAIAQPSIPSRPGSSTLINCHFESSLTEMQSYRRNGRESSRGGRGMYRISCAQ